MDNFMKTPEDEAFDELAIRQGDWGGGFQAKRAAAADKLVEDQIIYGASWSKNGERIDPMSVYLEEPAQEPVALVIDGVLVKSELPEKYTGHLYTTPPQCAALIWERDELQKQVLRYEKNGVTCQTYGHKVDSSCSECNVHQNYTTPPQRPWVGRCL